MEHAITLGSKTFAMEDQCLMALWSGDHNPLHVDPVAARRLLTGRPVVHGVHLVLEALARWAALADALPCTTLQAEFSKPVSVGDQVDFMAERLVDMTVLTGKVGGLTHMSLKIGRCAADVGPDPLPSGEPLVWKQQPLDLPAADWLNRTVDLPAVSGQLPAAQQAAQLIGGEGAALLGQASTMVGMGCPGLHSVFASLSLARREVPGQARCRVERLDPRFGLVRMRLDGPWYGEIRAFVRAAPRAQADMAAVMARVPSRVSGDHRTWVLGGSRGLGELAGKIAAAAGSSVTLTYAQGKADAERVAQDIRRAGSNAASVAHYEAGRTDLAQLCSAHGMPDTVLYFATPRIAQRRCGAFSADMLAAFNSVYCAELARIAVTLDALAATQGINRQLCLFNPSSVYVNELPNGMVEYAMSKAASEVLAADLNKRLTRVRIVSHRLPKLPTDQTNGLIADVGPSAMDVLEPLVLSMLTPG